MRLNSRIIRFMYRRSSIAELTRLKANVVSHMYQKLVVKKCGVSSNHCSILMSSSFASSDSGIVISFVNKYRSLLSNCMCL